MSVLTRVKNGSMLALVVVVTGLIGFVWIATIMADIYGRPYAVIEDMHVKPLDHEVDGPIHT